MEDIAPGGSACGDQGVVTGVMLGIARVAGEAAPMLFTAFGNPYLSTDVRQPIVHAAAYDLHLCHFTVQRLARQGLDDGPGSRCFWS